MNKRSSFTFKRGIAFLLVLIMVLQILPSPSLFAADTNLALDTELLSGVGGTNITEVSSGQSFVALLKYAIYPQESEKPYENLVISLTLSSEIVLDEDELDKGKTNDVASISIIDNGNGTQTIYYFLNDTIYSGEAKQISVPLKFPNMITANGTKSTFTAKIYGQVERPDGERDPINQDSKSNPTITATAGDTWEVRKTALLEADNAADPTYQYVTYTLTADFATQATYDRNGRLELDKFALKDLLPANSGAQFVSLKADNMEITTGDYSLENDTDGSLKSITITKYRTSAPGASNVVPDGTSMKSVYTLRVKYPKDKYLTPSDETLKMHTLLNNAELIYSLVTEDADKTSESSASVEIGWMETTSDAQSITIQKNLKVGDKEFPLTASMAENYGKPQFSLYKDAECTFPAKDINGNSIDAQVLNIETNAEGKILFSNLRFGTFYIKETTSINGFSQHAVVKVTLAADGSVKFGEDETYDDDGIVTITNETYTGGMGIIELYKKGFGASGGANVPLEGVVFELLDSNGISLSPAKTAVSDANGYVRFDAVPAGSYQVKEKTLPVGLSNEYTLNPTVKNVTVAGNDVVTIATDVAEETDPGVFLNQSEKGRFQLFKVDGKDAEKFLAGAKFTIYGPSETEPDPASAEPLYEDVVVPAAGYLSEPLAPGTYWVMETEAAEGYALNSELKAVAVTNNSIAPVTVENDALGQFAIKKWGSWNAIYHYTRLNGVVFNLYTDADATTPLLDQEGNPVTFTSYADATGQVSAERYITLPPGTYWFQEAPETADYKLPEGYAYNGNIVEFTITAGEITAPDFVNTANWGRIQIQKLNSHTGDPLNGATFKIYSDSECTTLVDTITITENGIGISKLLPVTGAAYYIKETVIPGGYFQPLTIISGVDADRYALSSGTGIELTANASAVVKVNNDPSASIKISKTDEMPDKDGNAVNISGTVFRIYATEQDAENNTNPIAEQTTSNDGVLTFSGLKPATEYWIREISVPSPSILVSAPVMVKTPAIGDASLIAAKTITNQRPGTLKIGKTGLFDNASSSMQGAEFTVYKNTGDAATDVNGTPVGKITIGANGTGTLTNVTPGKYWIVETKACDGFALDATPVEVEVKSGDNTGNFRALNHADVENTADKGKLQLKKVSSIDSAIPVSGATFALYKKIDDTPTYAAISSATLITGSDGTVTSAYLEPGVYLLKETEKAPGYTLNPSIEQEVTIEAGKTADLTNTPFTNVPEGSLKLTKTGTWYVAEGDDAGKKVENLAGAVFGIYKNTTGTSADYEESSDYAGDGFESTNPNFVDIVKTKTDGTITKTGLAAGNYWVIELQAPDGFKLNETPNSVTVLPGEQTAFTVEDTPLTGRIRLYKEDLVNANIRLNAAKFELYYVDDVNGTSTTVDGSEIKLTRDTSVGNLETGTETSGDGTFLTVSLDPDRTYYLKEITPPPDYEIISVWTGPITLSAGMISETTVQNYKPSNPTGNKQDKDRNSLSGAIIGLFGTSSAAEDMNTYLNSNEITSANLTDDFKNTHKILQTAVSNAQGVFEFQNLVPGQTYYAVELVSPDTYIRTSHVYEVTVSDTGDTFTVALNIINYRKGQIAILKQTTVAGVVEPLQGAEFKIYKAVPKSDPGSCTNHICDENCAYEKGELVYTGYSGTDGGVTGGMLSGFLAPGQYIVEESQAPEGYEADPNRYHVTVERDTINQYLAGGEGNITIMNEALYGRFVMTKVDDSGAKVTAAFTLQKFNEEEGEYEDYKVTVNGSEEIFTFTVDKSEAYYTSPMLPAGKYRAVETPVTGYTPASDTEIDIEGGKVTNAAGIQDVFDPASPNPIKVVNDRQGRLTIQKTGTFQGATVGSLAGVTFAVYPRTSGDADADYAAAQIMGTVRTMTTASGGTATMSNLDAGDYWLKETSVGTSNPQYAIAKFEPLEIVIEKGGTTSYTGTNVLENPTTYGKLSITKTDANAPAVTLTGATFGIYNNKACAGAAIETVTTGSNGVATSGLLAPGHYWIKEITAPAGYHGTGVIYGGEDGYLVEEQVITSVPVENEKIITVIVKKQDSEVPDKIMTGISFAIFATEQDAIAGTNPIQTVATARVGNENLATFTNLYPMKDYWVREMSTPEGYVVNNTVYKLTTGNDAVYTHTAIVENIPQGKISIKKVADWTYGDDPSRERPINGAVFTIYKYDGDIKGDIVGTITTTGTDNSSGEDMGIGTSGYLDPGKYLLEETTPPTDFQFDPANEPMVITVEPGETNTYYIEFPVNNIADKGQFEIQKIVEGTSASPTLLSGAVFLLEVRTSTNPDAWEVYNPVSQTITVNGKYTSGMISSGHYRLIETAAPAGYTLDPTPIEFEVTAGKTVYLTAENSAQGSITLTKTGDTQNGSPELQGAQFQLYKNGEAYGAPATTDAKGVVTWSNLDAATYTIVEVKPPEGYALSTEKIAPVVVAKGPAAVDYPVSVRNNANMGRIRITKTEVDNPTVRLDGARFEVYTVVNGNAGVKVDEGLITGSAGNEQGVVLSKLLPAADNGTEYIVREIYAPAGYTLDDRLVVLEKKVTVKPIHAPAEAAATNNVTFENRRVAAIGPFPSSINKAISPSQAATSLHVEPFSTTFKLSDFANGQNPLPFDKFIVTDSTIAMQSYDTATATYSNVPIKAGDYRINSVRVYKAFNDNGIGGQVNATIQYQTFEQLGTGNWTDLPASYKMLNLQDLTTDYKVVNLDLAVSDATTVCAVRVVYEGAGTNFKADSIMMDVTFAKRPGGANEPEILRVTNQASSYYEYTTYDNGHSQTTNKVTKNSAIVMATLPSLEDIKPVITVQNKVQYLNDKPTAFTNGSKVNYKITGTNESLNGAVLYGPIMSVYLPAYTTLDSSVAYTITGPDGALYPLEIKEEVVDAVAPRSFVEGSGAPGDPDELIPIGNGVKTKLITFIFPDDFALEPGQTITIDYQVIINMDKPKDTISLYSPAFMSSSEVYPVTEDNPKGTSFKVGNGKPVENGTIDDSIGADSKDYAQAEAWISVTTSSSVQVLKRVKGPLDADYLQPGELSFTYPGGDIYYQVSIYNNQETPAQTVRMIDILPSYDDSYVIRNSVTNAATKRATELSASPVLVDVIAPGATIYYYTGAMDTAARAAAGPMEAELPMLYENDSTAWTAAGWTTAKPSDMSTVTAIGVEYTYGASSDEGLETGEAYTFEIKMKAPEFTANQMDAFYNKIIANSCAGVLINYNASKPGTPVENEQVKSYMRLPTGSIGDYMFDDRNNNGLQDAGDAPFANESVTLYRMDHTSTGDASYTYKTTTDSSGYYLFENLPCNYLKDPDDPNVDLTDPMSYIGNSYSTYVVEFKNSNAEYAPTIRAAGNGSQPALDSDIYADGRTDEIRLWVKVDPNTQMLIGDHNLDIDAGYVIPARLGNKVWLDTNRNGQQDPGEAGVNGVTVNLYRVDDDGKVGDSPYATTLTGYDDVLDENGIYWFDKLTPGRYVVEFDIRALLNDATGYYQYSFTQANALGDDDDNDSDAAIPADADKRIMRTEVVTLISRQEDSSWDAGLTVISALGGYCFDDQNYNDVQDLGIALPGTVVSLYKVVNGKRESNFIDRVTVGADGKFFFDNLIEGQYQVHYAFPTGYKAVNALQGGDITLDSNVELELSGDLNSGYSRIIDLPFNTVDRTWDAGARLYGAIGDYVWYDANRNGIQDAGENPVKGVKVTLQRRNTASGLWEYYAETWTDANGYYLFEGLMCGTVIGYQYRVLFNPPDKMYITTPYAGNDTAKDSNALTIQVEGYGYPTDVILLDYGKKDLTIDAGLITSLGTLGDFVWYDLNKNGVQDAGEPGVEGVIVVLEYDASGELGVESNWVEIGQQVTDENGYYRFYDLEEGYYRVKFKIPSEYMPTYLNKAEGENSFEIDSDAFEEIRDGWYFTRALYLEADGFDLSWDMGIVPYSNTPISQQIKTGDHNNRMMWSILAALSVVAMAVLSGYKIHRRRRIQD